MTDAGAGARACSAGASASAVRPVVPLVPLQAEAPLSMDRPESKMVPKMQIGSGIGFPRGIRNRVRSSS